MSQVIQTQEQQVYLSKLLGYDYTIQYKAGKHNVVVDALSRPTNTSSDHFFHFLYASLPFLGQIMPISLR